MIAGSVARDGIPVVMLPVAGQNWPAIIDTGFNGDLELPNMLRPHVNARFKGRFHSLLAGGQTIAEDTYQVDFPFDGCTVVAEATFVRAQEILIGTRILQQYWLKVDFPAARVELGRVV